MLGVGGTMDPHFGGAADLQFQRTREVGLGSMENPVIGRAAVMSVMAKNLDLERATEHQMMAKIGAIGGIQLMVMAHSMCLAARF